MTVTTFLKFAKEFTKYSMVQHGQWSMGGMGFDATFNSFSDGGTLGHAIGNHNLQRETVQPNSTHTPPEVEGIRDMRADLANTFERLYVQCFGYMLNIF